MTDEIEIDIEREAGEGNLDGKITEEATSSEEFHIVKSTKKPKGSCCAKILMMIIYDGYICSIAFKVNFERGCRANIQRGTDLELSLQNNNLQKIFLFFSTYHIYIYIYIYICIFIYIYTYIYIYIYIDQYKKYV